MIRCFELEAQVVCCCPGIILAPVSEKLRPIQGFDR